MNSGRMYSSDESVVHYDLIVSADRLMKNAVTLDRLRYHRYKLTTRSSVSGDYIISSSQHCPPLYNSATYSEEVVL